MDTCPGAGICKEYCFAISEQKQYTSARLFRQVNKALTESTSFITTISDELSALERLHQKSGKSFAVRIHASGDFYSPRYIADWFRIMLLHPNVRFYAYTKSVAMFKRFEIMPANFVAIYSLGSNQDALIDLTADRHARIFKTEADAKAAGYTLASEDDAVAWSSDNHKIGLVIFGATKKFANLTKGFQERADKSASKAS